MSILVIAEHDAACLRRGTLSAIGFARSLVQHASDQVEILVLGYNVGRVTEDAAGFASVLVADDEALSAPVADRYAKVIAGVAQERQATHLVAASTTFSKDIVGRAAGLLGGAMASDVVDHEFRDGQLLLRRPMFAGSVTATVTLSGSPQVVTIQPAAYTPVRRGEAMHEIVALSVDRASLPNHICFEHLDSKASHRPDVTEARIVCSGGRAIKSADDFEQLVGRSADALGGATGSSRALVDAGITSNDLQVGQTGKIVAPELYFALGISGAVQHLAGMKNSKVIVAINSDPDAPISKWPILV